MTKWGCRCGAVALLFVTACGGKAVSVSHGEGGRPGNANVDAGSGGAATGNVGSGGAATSDVGGVDEATNRDARGAGETTDADVSRGTRAERIAACTHSFAVANSTRCGGAGLAPDEAKRAEPLYVNDCLRRFDVPGSIVTAADIEACAAAYDIADCTLVDGPPEECDFRGSLGVSARCFTDGQCQGNCITDGRVGPTPSGYVPPYECGHCSDVAAVGETCALKTCVAGSVCIAADSSSSSSYPAVCVAVHVGTLNDSCDELSRLCANDLYCERDSRTCQLLGVLDERCGSMWPTGCLAPNYCSGSSGTCTRPGSIGDDCSRESHCAAGLACDATTLLCGAVMWVDPGDPCDFGANQCRSGTCVIVGTQEHGTCPFIAAEGDVCDTTHACDVGSICYHGVCEGVHAVTCK